MKKYGQETNQILLTIATLLLGALFAVLAWYALKPFFQRVALDYYYPWNKALLATESAAATEVLAAAKSKRELAAMVADLQQKNAELAAATAADGALRQENMQLRTLLNMPLPPERIPVYAQVMLRDPMTWNETFVIDKGEAHGIRQGDPVVAPSVQGGNAVMAGRILSVSRHTAVAATVFHKECALSVLLTESGQYGFLNGAGGASAPVITSLPVNGRYGVGEIVMTGGLSHQTPPGLFLGTLAPQEDGSASVVKDHLYAEGLLKPAADIRDLRFVTVLTRKGQ